MSMNNEEHEEEVWVRFLRRHYKLVIVVVVAAIAAALGGLFIFLEFVKSAQASGLVPSTLGDWTVGYSVTFLLNLLLWELMIIIPLAAIAIVIFLHWWKKLPDDEQEEYQNERKKRTPRSGMTAGSGGGIIWFLIVVVWLIIIHSDGMWNTAFNIWPLSYLVYSTLTAVLWVLLIAGIPIAIFLVWWLHRELSKSS